MCFLKKAFICCRPFSVQWTRFWTTSSGRSTPVAILRSASESWVNGSIIKPEEKQPVIFLTSSSSLSTLLGADSFCSLCNACSLSWSPYMAFRAEVIPLQPTGSAIYQSLLRFTLSRRWSIGLSVETCDKGCPWTAYENDSLRSTRCKHSGALVPVASCRLDVSWCYSPKRSYLSKIFFCNIRIDCTHLMVGNKMFHSVRQFDKAFGWCEMVNIHSQA